MLPALKDAFVIFVLRASLVFAAALLLFVFFFLFNEATPALSELGVSRFFTDESWNPLENRFYLVPMLAGTLFSTAIALILALPLGIGFALYVEFVCDKRLSYFLLRVLELLAGIPSVVFGFWGLVSVVPLVAALRAPGASLLCAGLILALMILPTVALGTHAAICSVDKNVLRASESLSLSLNGTLFRLVLPMARSGIQTAIVLALARALGETMAVLMVAGNVARVPQSLLDPVRTLTANIALEMAYAMGLHRSSLFVSGLFVMFLVVVLLVCNRLFARMRAVSL